MRGNVGGVRDGYWFGFNGKEKDDEVFGATGTFQDYGFRMYDTRVARFISVDPLRNKFPYYTPYQFSGNSPVKFIDLDGLEPAESENQNLKGKEGRMWAVNGAYNLSGGDDAYMSRPITEKNGSYAQKVDPSKFIGNQTTDAYSRFVNASSQFNVTNENAYGSENDLVNDMLGNFVWGMGPENYVFPENGKFSNIVKGSIAVGEALSAWSKGGRADGEFSWNMDPRGQANVFAHASVTSIEQFMGSVTTRISKIDADHIRVEIFNITSLTSGDFTKDLTLGLVTPLFSSSRDGGMGKQTDHTNISQYFSVTMSTSEADKLVKQFTPPSSGR